MLRLSADDAMAHHVDLSINMRVDYHLRIQWAQQVESVQYHNALDVELLPVRNRMNVYFKILLDSAFEIELFSPSRDNRE